MLYKLQISVLGVHPQLTLCLQQGLNFDVQTVCTAGLLDYKLLVDSPLPSLHRSTKMTDVYCHPGFTRAQGFELKSHVSTVVYPPTHLPVKQVNFKRKERKLWLHTLLILLLGRQRKRQSSLSLRLAWSIYGWFQASHGYTVRLCLKAQIKHFNHIQEFKNTNATTKEKKKEI